MPEVRWRVIVALASTRAAHCGGCRASSSGCGAAKLMYTLRDRVHQFV